MPAPHLSDVCEQVAHLKSVLAATDASGFKELSQLGDALTQCLNFEAHVPPAQRYECQRPRWALEKELRRGIDQRGIRALWELGAAGFRESRDRDLVTEVVNELLRLASWDFFGFDQIEGPADLVRLHADQQSKQGFQRYFRLYRDVWLPLRARFNALATSVAGALGLQHENDERDARAQKKVKGNKPGNPKNVLSRTEKTKRKNWLRDWERARNRMTFNEFLDTFPNSEREAVRKGVKTAQRWKSDEARAAARR